MSETLFPAPEELDALLVGRGSMAWQLASDVRLYLVMLYPLLLQVAHPTVGAGVHDFSDFEKRPWDRLMRTLDYVNLLVYGGREAVPAGRRLRALHKGFRGVRADGERYYALEPEAYAWVHATLIDTYVAGHGAFGRRLRRDEVERFYREYRGLGRLIGVREDALPEDWAGFRRYFRRMCASLERTESVERVLATIAHAPQPPLPVPGLLWSAIRLPASRALWLAGVGLLDPALRSRLGIPWSRRDQAAYLAVGRATRALGPLLPQRLQVMGPDHLRWRRRTIARGPLGPGAEPGARAAGRAWAATAPG